jgi:hypothetical protein
MAELLDMGDCRQVEGPVRCVVVCRGQLAHVAVPFGAPSLCRRFLGVLGKEYDMRSSVAKKGPLYMVRVQGHYYVVYNACVPGLEYRAAKHEEERLLLKLMDSSLALWALVGAAAISLTALTAAGVYSVKTQDGSTSIIKQLIGRKTPPPFSDEFLQFWDRVLTVAPNLEVPSQQPDADAIQYYIDSACGENKVVLDILFNGIKHVSYDTFKQVLRTATLTLDKARSYTLCLFSNTGGVLGSEGTAPGTKVLDASDHWSVGVFCAKSNFWVSALVYCFMKKENYDVRISTEFDKGNDVLLICDDALYSGKQMFATVGYYTQFKKDLCVLVAYCSVEGQTRIKKHETMVGRQGTKPHIQFVIGETMINHQVIIAEGLKRLNSNLTVEDVTKRLGDHQVGFYLNWYYFDHKWPDGDSFALPLNVAGLYEWGCPKDDDEYYKSPKKRPFPTPGIPPYRVLCSK